MRLHLIKWKDERGLTQTFRLVDRVSASWKNFGIILGLTMNQLKRWEDQYRGDSNSCWARVMEFWLSGGSDKDDYPVTWEGLYTLLYDTEYSVVADELKMVVDDTTTLGSREDGLYRSGVASPVTDEVGSASAVAPNEEDRPFTGNSTTLADNSCKIIEKLEHLRSV